MGAEPACGECGVVHGTHPQGHFYGRLENGRKVQPHGCDCIAFQFSQPTVVPAGLVIICSHAVRRLRAGGGWEELEPSPAYQ